MSESPADDDGVLDFPSRPHPDAVATEVVSILDTIEVPIVVVGRDCRVTRFNRAAAETLGITPADVGRRASSLQSLAATAGIEQLCIQAMLDGLPSRHDVRYGDSCFVAHIAPFTGSDQQVGGAVLTFTNVTAFRASLTQAIHEREFTKTILNAVRDPLLVLDAGGNIQTANRAFHTWFGVSREQTQRARLRELGGDAWKAAGFWAALETIRTEGHEFQTVELEDDFPGVGRRTVLIDARSLARGNNALVLLALRDITARKSLEHERELLLAEEASCRREAERAVAAKDRFLAALSHELRTPLSPIVLAVSAVENHPEFPLALQKYVTIIRRNIELEIRLIDDLLDVNRVVSGKMPLKMEPTHLHRVLAEVVQSGASEPSAKNLDVRLEITADNDLVIADSARIQQVFSNLLRNSAKFTPHGGTIVIRTENANGNLRVEVRDTGIGIEAELLPKLFDVFEQGDIKITRQYGGLGLGLSICKSIVNLHGGAIRAHSEGPGTGATFTVELPTSAAANDETTARLPQARASGHGHACVLVVEDHSDSRELLASMLGHLNYTVRTANSVESALELAAVERFDIVLSDLGLPDGTGWDLMKQLRDRYGIKGIALSGYGMGEDQRRSKDAGFLGHVVKPVDPTQLLAVIERITKE